jgi:hypothetical protein
MSSIKYIHHHLGLGDHFCCSGLVLELLKRWQVDQIGLFCWDRNLSTLEKLYESKNVKLIPIDSTSDEGSQIERYLMELGMTALNQDNLNWETGEGCDFFRIGFNWMEQKCHREISSHVSCDQCFYLQAGVPYELRFDGFPYKRNLERESEIYNDLNPTGEPYIFVAIDDPTRGLICPSRSFVDSSTLKIIENPKEYSVLDLGLLLERASEIHLMESSIRCMIEARNTFNMIEKSLYLHAWRGSIWGNNSLLNWNVVWQDNSVTRCERKYPMYSGKNGEPTESGFIINL